MKHIILVFTLLFLGAQGYSQSISRGVISSFGGVTIQNGLRMTTTVGEVGSGSHNGSLQVRSGYVQPIDWLFVGVEETEQITFQAFPNPFRNEVHLRFSEVTTATVQLYDLNGRLVFEQEDTGQLELTLNLPQLNDGLYLLRILSDGKLIEEKKLIKHS